MTHHVHRPPRKPTPAAGLQDIHTTAVRYGAKGPKGTRYDHGRDDAPEPLPTRYRMAAGTNPNTPYTCPELGRTPGIPDGRYTAYALPSRVGNRLFYPDGRVEDIKP